MWPEHYAKFIDGGFSSPYLARYHATPTRARQQSVRAGEPARQRGFPRRNRLECSYDAVDRASDSTKARCTKCCHNPLHPLEDDHPCYANAVEIL
jgi:hypothetical protein